MTDMIAEKMAIAGNQEIHWPLRGMMTLSKKKQNFFLDP
jgi:hypothetical protein